MLLTSTRLNNGIAMPLLGFGVFRAGSGGGTRRAVLEALKAGYRHIDTAQAYGNEDEVGDAVRESGLPREELFVTTKLWNAHHGYDRAQQALDESLARMRFDYVDLFLIHWPVENLRDESWRALVQLQKDGKAKAIGVSNYLPRHLAQLLSKSDVVPQVDQIELHPFLTQRETVAVCERHDIAVAAYSPLTKGKRLGHPEVVAIAEEYQRTPAQILLRWGVQHGYAVLPKSVTPSRIRENAAIFDFELAADDLARLDGLNEDLYTGWDSRQVP